MKQQRRTYLKLPDNVTFFQTHEWFAPNVSYTLNPIKNVDCPWRLTKIAAGSQAHTGNEELKRKPPPLSGILPKLPTWPQLVSGLLNCLLTFLYFLLPLFNPICLDYPVCYSYKDCLIKSTVPLQSTWPWIHGSGRRKSAAEFHRNTFWAGEGPQEVTPLKTSPAKKPRGIFAQWLREDPDPRQTSPVTKHFNQLTNVLCTVTPNDEPFHRSWPRSAAVRTWRSPRRTSSSNQVRPGSETRGWIVHL